MLQRVCAVSGSTLDFHLASVCLGKRPGEGDSAESIYIYNNIMYRRLLRDYINYQNIKILYKKYGCIVIKRVQICVHTVEPSYIYIRHIRPEAIMLKNFPIILELRHIIIHTFWGSRSPLTSPRKSSSDKVKVQPGLAPTGSPG